MVEAKKYKFTRADFEPLITKPLHFDMLFDIHEDKVQVTLNATYKYKGTLPKNELKLNSKKLQILSVERYGSFQELGESKKFPEHVKSLKDPSTQEFDDDAANDFLIVKFAEPIQPDQEFVIRTVSIATPTENILEGLYYDFAPEGCPKTIITQCQQYGFQRIVPCIDTMDAKAFYTTTIVADKRYTNMITNGDLAPGYHNELGEPIYHETSEVLEVADESRHVLKYYNHKVNMAPYLFFLGVGTYNTYRQTLEFPDGDTTLLELLSYPGRATPEDAKTAVQMLHDSVLWVMISLGPEACQHCDKRKEIYELIKEREDIKRKQGPLIYGSNEKRELIALSDADSSRLCNIRSRLKELISIWGKTGYKYTGAVYREIAMENSYYGGMENVGNTTIVSSCLCPSCNMTDGSYEYMERVKVHEYYHNINGSQVTGQSPFEIWLNEAVTVHMERKRYADLFGSDYTRLSEVTYMFRPALGPLAQDKSSTSLSVEPEGFNQTQELVSVVTYSKAPEFVRMIELILGYEKFHQALDLYHTEFSYGNATTMDWIKKMEEASGLDLQHFAKTWLKRPGFPTVKYNSKYDINTKSYTVSMIQEGFEDKPIDNNGPWDIPIDWALVKDGAIMKSGLYRFDTKQNELIISDVEEEPDFLSFARGWSFFGMSVNESATPAQLKKQATTDPDAINRYFAYRALADAEKAKIIESMLVDNKDYTISKDYVDLHHLILFDESLSPSTRALTLEEPNSIPSREDLSHCYKEINNARKAMLQAVWHNSAEKVESYFKKLQDEITPGPQKEKLNERALLNHLSYIISCGSKPLISNVPIKTEFSIDAFTLSKDLLESSPFFSNRLAAFKRVLEFENQPERSKIQEKIFNHWAETATLLESYISVISSLDTQDVGEQIRKLMEDKHYNINLSSHTRTITRGLSQIRQFSILTDEGLNLMVDVFLRIGKVNQMSAYPILKSFDQLNKFDQTIQDKLKNALQRMQDGIDSKKEESLYNQLNIMLNKV